MLKLEDYWQCQVQKFITSVDVLLNSFLSAIKTVVRGGSVSFSESTRREEPTLITK